MTLTDSFSGAVEGRTCWSRGNQRQEGSGALSCSLVKSRREMVWRTLNVSYYSNTTGEFKIINGQLLFFFFPILQLSFTISSQAGKYYWLVCSCVYFHMDTFTKHQNISPRVLWDFPTLGIWCLTFDHPTSKENVTPFIFLEAFK